MLTRVFDIGTAKLLMLVMMITLLCSSRLGISWWDLHSSPHRCLAEIISDALAMASLRMQILLITKQRTAEIPNLPHPSHDEVWNHVQTINRRDSHR